MGYEKLVRVWPLLLVLLFSGATSGQVLLQEVTWQDKMTASFQSIEKKYPKQLGVYVKRVKDQSEYSYRGDDLWYIASGVKLPIALEVFRQIDEGKFNLNTKVTLTKDDYVDGAGSTNLQKPGSRLTILYLLQQMMIYSDNTASDLLIKQVGIDPINVYLKSIVPSGFEKITTLAEVRRLAYGEVHPSAHMLTGTDFLLLKSIKNDKERFEKLREILKLKESDLLCKDFRTAYSNYYSRNYNSATLKAYGSLLEQLSTKEILSQQSQRALLKIMTDAETGKKRIEAGLPKGFKYAHKTGTQRSRICDFGVAWKQGDLSANNAVVITACVRDFKNLKTAESALREVAESLSKSGVFL